MDYLNVLAFDPDANHLSSLKTATMNTSTNISLTTFFDESSFLDCLCSNKADIDAVIINADRWTMTRSGFDTARIVADRFPELNIIFSFSGLSARVEEAFLLGPNLRVAGIVLFPIEEKRLERLYACLLTRKIKAHKQVVVPSNGRKAFVNAEDIIMVSSEKRKLVLELDKKETVSFYGQLKSMRAHLPEYFLMPHTSYLVNAYFIDKVAKSSVFMENGKEVPISRSCRKEFLDGLSKITNIKDLAESLSGAEIK